MSFSSKLLFFRQTSALGYIFLSPAESKCLTGVSLIFNILDEDVASLPDRVQRMIATWTKLQQQPDIQRADEEDTADFA